MLETLQRVVHAVNTAADFPIALQIVVDEVAAVTEADVCSVYLHEENPGYLRLMATRGLNADAVGEVQLAINEGLVGLVAERQESINLGDADQHPRFRYFPETGEERFHSFLGVPIIHYQSRLGVLVVQRGAREEFSDAEVAFLVTMAAQLAGAIAHARMRGDLTVFAAANAKPPPSLTGIAGSSGIAMGTAVVVANALSLDSVPDRLVLDADTEISRFMEAVESVKAEIATLAERMRCDLPEAERLLFDVYQQMLNGDSLIGRVRAGIQSGLWAPGALRQTIAEHAQRFAAMDDPYLRERVEDVRDLGQRLLMRLMSGEAGQLQELPDRVVLVGEALSAAQLADIPAERLAAVVSVGGSANSHVAILARALGVPAVMGVQVAPLHRLEGRELIVDGYQGQVMIDPPSALRAEYQRLQREDEALSEGLRSLTDAPAVTPDGHRVALYVNTGLLAEVELALHSGCAGVGLHRTEFPFLMGDRFPGETEQMVLYREVLAAFAPLPVTLRTLDVGGDKPLPYFPMQDENPFLGWRGLRMTLDHPEIFLAQIKAMLRASVGLNNLQIMFPMISRLEEAEQAMLLVARARAELEEEGVLVKAPPLGALIEVPAAVYQAASLAKRFDFLSIGTNDLAQYLLAVDRNNSQVAGLYDERHPAVLRAVNEVAEVGQRLGKPVTVCGSMAGEPELAILLMAMGVEGLSVNSGRLLRVKWALRSISLAESKVALKQSLMAEYPEEVTAIVTELLSRHGLEELIHAERRTRTITSTP